MYIEGTVFYEAYRMGMFFEGIVFYLVGFALGLIIGYMLWNTKEDKNVRH